MKRIAFFVLLNYTENLISELPRHLLFENCVDKPENGSLNRDDLKKFIGSVPKMLKNINSQASKVLSKNLSSKFRFLFKKCCKRTGIS